MSDVNLGGGNKKSGEPQKQKLLYIGIPTAIQMIIELSDSKSIKKYSDPIVADLKKSFSNKELRKMICPLFGVKTSKKFKSTRPVQFERMTEIFGDIWGL